MGESLFRPEVIEHRAQRLHGEVVISQSLSTRVVVAGLAAMALVVCLWLALGSFARTETARGSLVTVVPSVKAVAPLAGIVTSLNVAEGAKVRKGQVLAVVTMTRLTEDGGDAVRDNLDALRARMALLNSQVGLEGARLDGERTRLSAMLASAVDDERQLDDQVALQEEVVESSRALFEQIEKVVERGFVSRVEFEHRRQGYLAARQSLGTLAQQRAAARSRAAEARGSLESLKSQSAAQVDQIRSDRLALAQQEAQLRGEQTYVVASSINGRVTALQTALGRATAVGGTLMTVVPESAPLQAEVYAPSRAIGLVRPGQRTRLLYDAFPYQRFGSFGGRIVSVSGTAIDPRENDVPVQAEEMVYRVVVSLDRQSIPAYGSSVALQPGMTFTANIVLERQSFFAWLLTPLRAVINRT